jgi:alcohol dehydrogenase class IV
MRWSVCILRKHNHSPDTLCQQALRYLFQHPPRATHDPQDLDARLHCQLGAWMSIIGFASVRTGISHAIGHQLGGHCHVPHGQTSCIMLPHAMEFNRPVVADRLALVAEAAGLDTRQITTEQAASAAIDAVRRLIGKMDCPMRLRDVGVQERDFPVLAEAVLEEVPTWRIHARSVVSPTSSNSSSAPGEPVWHILMLWQAWCALDIAVYARAVAATTRRILTSTGQWICW